MPVMRIVSYNIHKGRSASGGRESLADLRLEIPNLALLYGEHRGSQADPHA